MNTYTIVSNTYTIVSTGKHNYTIENVSEDFINSCSTFKDMMECSNGNENIIPMSGIFTEKLMKDYINYFEFFNNLKVPYDGQDISYLDYMEKHQDDYIEKYTNKNLDPPHCTEIYNFYKEKQNLVNKIMKENGIDNFLNNTRFRLGVFLTIACIVRKDSDAEVNPIINLISKRYKKIDDEEYLKRKRLESKSESKSNSETISE